MDELDRRIILHLNTTLGPPLRVLAYLTACLELAFKGTARSSASDITARVVSEHRLRPPEAGRLLRTIGLGERLYSGRRLFILDAEQLTSLKSYYEELIGDIEVKLKVAAKSLADNSARIDNLRSQWQSLLKSEHEIKALENKLQLSHRVELRLQELRIENERFDARCKELEEAERKNKELKALMMRLSGAQRVD